MLCAVMFIVLADNLPNEPVLRRILCHIKLRLRQEAGSFCL